MRDHFTFGYSRNIWTIFIILVLSGCTHSPPRPPVISDIRDSTRSLETISTRPGVQQSFLLIKPREEAAKTLVIFPGGMGNGQVFIKDGSVRTKGSFVARTIDLWKQRYRLVVIDTPSDGSWGISPTFRSSENHRLDIEKVLDAVSKRWPTEFYLIGTSLSTVSVAAIGASRDPRIKGLILTSTHVEKLNLKDLEKIQIPILLMSHRDDSCKFTLAADSRRLQERLSQRTRVDYIELIGGSSTGDPCEAFSYHGFAGKEEEAIETIYEWILKSHTEK